MIGRPAAVAVLAIAVGVAVAGCDLWPAPSVAPSASASVTSSPADSPTPVIETPSPPIVQGDWRIYGTPTWQVSIPDRYARLNPGLPFPQPTETFGPPGSAEVTLRYYSSADTPSAADGLARVLRTARVVMDATRTANGVTIRRLELGLNTGNGEIRGLLYHVTGGSGTIVIASSNVTAPIEDATIEAIVETIRFEGP